MKPKNNFLLLLFLLLFVTVNAQIAQEQKQHIYTDYVADENGNRLKNITVQVQGGDRDITDVNGKFTVKAKYGDRITLYRNGKEMDSYIYDGSTEYKINDFGSDVAAPAIEKKESLSYHKALDSATYYVKKKPLKTIQFVEKALQATSNKKKTAKAYEILADAFYELKQYDLAQSNYLSAYEFYPKSIPLQLKLAKSYYKNSFYTKANLLFTQVAYQEKATPFQKIKALEGLASLSKRIKNYPKASNQLKLALSIAINHKITPKITSLNTKLASVNLLKGDVSQSDEYIKESFVSAKRESKNKAIVQTNKVADFYSKNNQVDKEIELRKRTLKELDIESIDKIDLNEKEVLSKPKVKYDLGKALVKKKAYNEAITYFEESASEAKETKDIETEKEAVKGLSETYATIGNDKKAIENYNRLSKLVDFSFKTKEKEIAQAIARSKDIANKQNRILSLEKDKALHQSNYELSLANNKRQKLIIYSLIGGLLLLLLSLFYMFKSNKQRKLANNLLALKSLRSQMNPHFIFNALNSVNSFISSNDERAANRYLTDFSTLMRSVLENSEQDFIPLEKEIELLSLYLKLEHSRFKDKFEYQFSVDEKVDVKSFKIPPMLLQPYVENAVWHGLRYKKEKGLLKVVIQQIKEDTLQIIIQDNGIGRIQSKALKSKNQQQKKSKGMQNIKQRVAILNEMYHDKVDVSITDLYNDKTGTQVILVLKKD